MNLREGFRRVYVIFAVCVCVAVGGVMFGDLPNQFKLAEKYRDSIARADVGPEAARQTTFDPFMYVIHQYGADLPISLEQICRHELQSLDLTVACESYKRQQRYLWSAQLREFSKLLGFMSLFGMGLYIIWRCLDWVFAGFASMRR